VARSGAEDAGAARVGSAGATALLVVAATALALAAAEGITRWMGERPFPRSREQALFWRYDAQLGWSQRPGASGRFETRAFRSSVSINSKGLRDGEHEYARGDPRRRVLVLGDSFAWGYGVEQGERFSEVLERDHGAEVINAGVSGYSTDQELLFYRSEGAKYEVDLVVLLFCGNDETENYKEHVYFVYHKPWFAIEKGALVAHGVPVPRARASIRLAHALRERSALFWFADSRWLRVGHVYWPAAREWPHLERTGGPLELTRALIAELAREVHARGAELLVAATPRWWSDPFGSSYASLLAALEADGEPVLDIEARAGFDRERMLLRRDAHWNAEGHAFAAAALWERIEQAALLP
jgi:hypothetical protein